MGGDLTRKRQGSQAPVGMGAPFDVEEGAMGRLVAQLQENIEELSKRLNAIVIPEISDGFDDTELAIKVRKNWQAIDRIKDEIRSLWTFIYNLEISSIHEAPSKVELPAVKAAALGYVTAGSELDRYYAREGDDATGDWKSFTHLET